MRYAAESQEPTKPAFISKIDGSTSASALIYEKTLYGIDFRVSGVLIWIKTTGGGSNLQSSYETQNTLLWSNAPKPNWKQER